MSEFLRASQVRLDPFERADLANVQRWINDEETRQFLSNVFPLNASVEEDWFKRVSESKTDVLFAVRLIETGRHVGNAGLHGIDWVNRSAEYGVILGEPSARDRGLGTELTRLILRYGFEELNLHRVQLRVFEYNARAVRCYEKAGYRLEGRLRQARFFRGRWRDVLWMSVLRDEFETQTGSTVSFGMCQESK